MGMGFFTISIFWRAGGRGWRGCQFLVDRKLALCQNLTLNKNIKAILKKDLLSQISYFTIQSSEWLQLMKHENT